MGEFQYYQFRTIDRPLSDSERREVDGLSSRGQVTGHSATCRGREAVFREKMEELCKLYSRRPGLIARWEKTGLIG